MKSTACILFASIWCCTSSMGADESAKAPTELETFQAKSGMVIIKGYSEIVTIPVRNDSSISIDAKEFVEAGTGERKYGITIEVKQAGRIERTAASSVDAVEIESLIAGIEYIAKIDKAATKLTNFEAHYRTRGELVITVFNQRNGELAAGITAGKISTASAYMTMADLMKVRDGIVKAREALDAIKKPTP